LQWLALFWVLLAFHDQSYWLLQLSISNVPWIHHFHVSLPSRCSVYPPMGGKPPQQGEVTSLQITIVDTYLNCLSFDWSMDLTWISLNLSLSHFLSTCLSPFLSTKWSPIITETSSSSWVWS
jgi:hypothetical protein